MDINCLHLRIIQIADVVELGHVTQIKAYIQIGGLVHMYKCKKGSFSESNASEDEIYESHEIFYNIPRGYHKDN